jgi:hypothetical protein
MEALVVDDRRRSRPRAGDTKTSVVTRRGTQIDLRVVEARQLGRGAAVLHRQQGPQHQAPPARPRPRVDAQRVRARRARGRQGHRERDRGADLRGAGSALHPAGASRGRGGDRGRRARRASAESRGRARRLPRAHGPLRRRSSLARGRGRAARARGYCALAITDHAEGTLSGVGREALLEQRQKIAALQARGGDDITCSTASSSTSAPPESSTTTPSSARFRLLHRLGARPLRSRSCGADGGS